nr:MAG TPA: hypothetical protein [Caudoviricetes sp.]
MLRYGGFRAMTWSYSWSYTNSLLLPSDSPTEPGNEASMKRLQYLDSLWCANHHLI